MSHYDETLLRVSCLIYKVRAQMLILQMGCGNQLGLDSDIQTLKILPSDLGGRRGES